MEKVIECIKREKMFSAGNVVGVACSGGSDSMALLHFLYENRELFDIEVMAIHVDHNTRENDVRDALFVEDYCKQHRIRFYKFKVEALKVMKQKAVQKTLVYQPHWQQLNLLFIYFWQI